jgi:hypothetical protein
MRQPAVAAIAAKLFTSGYEDCSTIFSNSASTTGATTIIFKERPGRKRFVGSAKQSWLRFYCLNLPVAWTFSVRSLHSTSVALRVFGAV